MTDPDWNHARKLVMEIALEIREQRRRRMLRRLAAIGIFTAVIAVWALMAVT